MTAISQNKNLNRHTNIQACNLIKVKKWVYLYTCLCRFPYKYISAERYSSILQGTQKVAHTEAGGDKEK